jgi:hypothetical protein
MILASHGLIASQIASGDPDWAAFYARVLAAGGSLTTTEQNATKTLVADMKAAGIWTLQKAIYPMVGASAAACAQNLKSASFTGTFSSGWTFASTGITGNGTSAYMDTNLTPSVSIASQDSISVSYYSRSNISTAVDFGVRVSTPLTIIIAGTCNDTGSTYFRLNHGLSESSAGNSGSSLKNYIYNRVSSTTESVFINATKTSITKLTSGNASLPIFLNAYNNLGSPSNYSNRQCAMFTIGDGLTDTQATDFYTAVQAFQTTLSRNV